MRRLGVGGGGGGDRPLRAQLVVALIAGLVLLAVPLYMWRRPSGTENAPSDAGADAKPALALSNLDAAAADANALDERVRLGGVQRVKCAASAGARGQEGNLCDQLPSLERALAQAIRDSIDCAPKVKQEGSINYVLSVDFRTKKLHVFPGASGSWKGPQARKAAKCVLKSLPAPAWTTLSPQYKFYQIAILATYPLPAPAPAPGAASGANTPLFD